MNEHIGNHWSNLLLHLSAYIDSQIYHADQHSSRVADLTLATARTLDCPKDQIELFYWAARLHDVGKVAVPGEILSKAAPLSDKEWQIMRLHPIAGASIVLSIPEVPKIAPIILHHQEKIDGSGYPQGLRGDEIPFGARLLAVVDAYDAMTNHRFYRRALGHSLAVKELQEHSGSHFDGKIVEAFLEVVNGGGFIL